MGNEPLWLLFERMRKALAEAARVSERATESVKGLSAPGDDEEPAKDTAAPAAPAVEGLSAPAVPAVEGLSAKADGEPE